MTEIAHHRGFMNDEIQRYSIVEKFGDSKIISFFFLERKQIILFRKDALNFTVNTLIMLQMISLSNKHFLYTFYLSNEPTKMTVSQFPSSTTVFNFDNN